jgi:hypothetical protein
MALQTGDKICSDELGQVIRMLEEIGTGGAGFRFIYAAFLQESAAILQIPLLDKLSTEMTEAGDRWREFAWQASRCFKTAITEKLPMTCWLIS